MTRAPHIPPIATGGKPPEACCVLHSQLLQRSVFGVQCSVLFPSQLASIQDSRNHNNTEDNRYIYHSDHLGSSAFLTDANGIPTQHLQYLSFGEPFIEQRSVTDYYTPYTFSAKERDLETGYSYFGARYYSSNLSIWLSVDPLSDKYPNQSGYCYVGWRPIIVIDPNGEDEWEVTSTGRVKWIKESDTHTLFMVDRKGNRTGQSLTLKDRSIFDQLAKGGSISKAIGNEKSQDAMMKTFMFMADNTDVEWSLDRFKENGKTKYALGSNHSQPSDQGGQNSPSAEDLGHPSASVIAFVHSHPNIKTDVKNEKSSMGWWPDKGVYTGDVGLKTHSELRNALYYTYFPESGRLWSVRSNAEPAFIRNIGSNYKRFFFGTLNTR